ncbi:MAG: AMP-binding protein [bacterium]|nr:AMP-binding protein [bacterium]
MFLGLNYDKEKYSIVSFLEKDFSEPFLKSAQRFIENWQLDKPFVFKSSGSTGAPKEFVFRRWQLKISAEATIKALGLVPESEHFLICIDTSFVGGAMMLARAMLLNCEVTFTHPSSNVFDKIPHTHSFTFGSFVPPQLMDASFSKEKYERFRNVLIGGSSLDLNKANQLSKMQVASYLSYGMTETLSHVALKRLNQNNGYKILEPYTVRINMNQQICIKVPFLEEELITQDLGIWVEPNQFEWIGRVDFVVNSGGIKISPEEIENAILGLGILDANCKAIISSIPSTKWGNELVLVTNRIISTESFKEVLIGLHKMGLKQKSPKRFFCINEFPSIENGKLARNKINEWLVNQEVSH